MGVRLQVRSCWTPESEFEAVFELEQTRIVIGRGRGADVRLPHRAVSARHATLESDGARYTLTDHETTNGTRVEGARLVPGRKKPLRDGDRIEIGGFSLRFQQGIAVAEAVSIERTASLARRLAREVFGDEAPRAPRLTFVNGPRTDDAISLPPAPARLVLGRGEDADIELPDEDASRAHAELRVDLDGSVVEDIASKNGVAVNGTPVESRRLRDRDELRIGNTVLLYEDPADERLRELEAGDDEEMPTPPLAEIAPEVEEPAEAEPEGDTETEPTPIAKPKGAVRRGGLALADVVIYVLAATIFAVSMMGLLWILRS